MMMGPITLCPSRQPYVGKKETATVKKKKKRISLNIFSRPLWSVVEHTLKRHCIIKNEGPGRLRGSKKRAPRGWKGIKRFFVLFFSFLIYSTAFSKDLSKTVEAGNKTNALLFFYSFRQKNIFLQKISFHPRALIVQRVGRNAFRERELKKSRSIFRRWRKATQEKKTLAINNICFVFFSLSGCCCCCARLLKRRL